MEFEVVVNVLNQCVFNLIRQCSSHTPEKIF